MSRIDDVVAILSECFIRHHHHLLLRYPIHVPRPLHSISPAPVGSLQQVLLYFSIGNHHWHHLCIFFVTIAILVIILSPVLNLDLKVVRIDLSNASNPEAAGRVDVGDGHHPHRLRHPGHLEQLQKSIFTQTFNQI